VLLAFRVIALFVGSFVIFSTLSITVAQRRGGARARGPRWLGG
jgi:ABC-type antimicrobial peptide transport system permease subunit